MQCTFLKKDMVLHILMPLRLLDPRNIMRYSIIHSRSLMENNTLYV